jgi:hypothetical protein
MNMSSHRLCAWSGVAFMVLFSIGWVAIARFLPPPSPSLTGGEVADFYRSNLFTIRLGLVLSQASLVFYLFWVASISSQLKRIEGVSPILSETQLIGGAGGCAAILIACLVWGAVSFRPDRPPELTLMLNDFGWIVFTTTFAPFMTQDFAIAWAIFADKSKTPLYPRWVGYFNIWTPLLFVPAGLILFFKTGPFAWNGILAFWIPLTIFFIWMIVMTVMTLKAMSRQTS